MLRPLDETIRGNGNGRGGTSRLFAVGLASLATNHIERERFDGKIAGHTAFRIIGIAAQGLFCPLSWLPRQEISEPRTTLLFAANSLLWGVMIATGDALLMRRRRSRRRRAVAVR